MSTARASSGIDRKRSIRPFRMSSATPTAVTVALKPMLMASSPAMT